MLEKLIDNGRIVLSNSARTSFCACRKMFEFRYLRGLRSKGYAKNLAVGSMVHDGLERYYLGAPWDIIGSAERFIKNEKRACPEWKLTEEEQEQFAFDQALADIIIKAYRNKYPRDEWEIVDVEHEGRLRLERVQLTDYAYKLDLVVRSKETRELVLVEHKTVGGAGIEEYISRLELDTQATGYWACVEADYKEPLSCVTYNLLLKPLLRQKKDETRKEFIERIRQDFQDNPDKYFMRANVYRSQAQLEGWLDDMVSIVRDLKNSANLNRFYRCPNSCNQWGKTCPYRSICMEDTPDMEKAYIKMTTPWPELTNVVGKEQTNGNGTNTGKTTDADAGEATLAVY